MSVCDLRALRILMEHRINHNSLESDIDFKIIICFGGSFLLLVLNTQDFSVPNAFT